MQFSVTNQPEANRLATPRSIPEFKAAHSCAESQLLPKKYSWQLAALSPPAAAVVGDWLKLVTPCLCAAKVAGDHHRKSALPSLDVVAIVHLNSTGQHQAPVGIDMTTIEQQGCLSKETDAQLEVR